ncbi:MAG TPA: hypothetical protein VG944_15790, partial [Fimbriimonas sp.]|nr:hypothetical protein [Fimbriimonas sp.]
MKQIFQPEWRTQNRLKRKFYARYMVWLERFGYLVVIAVIGAFLFAFNYPVDDTISADGVKLAAAATPVDAKDHTLIVRRLKNDFDDVKAGDPVLEVVEGDQAIQSYQRWQKIDSLRSDLGATADLTSLARRYPRPSTKTILAPTAGTFRCDPKTDDVAQGTEVCHVSDYSTVQLHATLTGDSVAKAAVGQWAKISNIDVESDSGTVLRATASQGPLLSHQVLGPEIRKDVAARLAGHAVQFRDDLPLKI